MSFVLLHKADLADLVPVTNSVYVDTSNSCVTSISAVLTFCVILCWCLQEGNLERHLKSP